MNKRTGLILFVMFVLIFTGVGRALAQDGEISAPQVVVGTGFTYQGMLKDGGGTPINKTCDFTFTLWDALAAGVQIGASSTVSAISVTNGAFSAVVNNGNQFGNTAFTGQARWLQIVVKCVGDAGYTTLSPRQAMTPAPYALSLRFGATIQGDGGASGTGLYVQNTTAGGTAYGLIGESASTSGRGVYGYASATTGGSTGVYGSSNSTSGYGVAGLASAASGATSGVYGTSASTSGRGVTGYANALSGSTSGVRGLADSVSGTGVYGGATAASGTTYGVRGVSASATGFGVYGSATAASGPNFGVKGDANSTAGIGVYGIATAASGTTYAVRGDAVSTSGTGVLGLANAASGTTAGVRGEAQSTGGNGVYGKALATSGYNAGVKGEAASTDGIGVIGLATDTSGVGFAYGVYGQTDSKVDVAGVYGFASAATTETFGVLGRSASNAGIGVYGYAPSSTGITYGIYGQSGSTGGFGVFGITSAGSGTTTGVYGKSFSTGGSGVFGYAAATTGTTHGVTGQSDSSDGAGVYAYAKSATGTTYGVFARSDSADGGAGVYGYSPNRTGVVGKSDRNSNDGFGVAGWGWDIGTTGVGAFAFGGDIIRGYSGDYLTGTLRFRVDNAGNVYADSGFGIFATSSLDGAVHTTSSIQSSENWVEDFGFASLQKGKTVVKIAADFAGIVDLTLDYHIYLTPMGDCALYVTDKTPTGFTVNALGGAGCSTDFDYRIVARPAGKPGLRLPEVTNPADSGMSRPAADNNMPAVPIQPADNNLPGEKPQK